MDSARSESAHQAAPLGPVTLIIRQNGRDLSVETKTSERDKPAIANETLVFHLDGTENTVTGSSGAQVTCKAHWDGPKLVTQTGRNIHDSTVTTRYELSLGEGGRELIINKTLTVQHGYQAPGAANNSGTAKDIFVKVKAAK